MQLTPVQDARIRALGYDEDSWTCYVQFPPAKTAPAGSVYAFASVPPEMFDDFRAAASPGHFFEQNLARKPEHPYTRLNEDGTPVARAEQPSAAGFRSAEEALATAQQIARDAEALVITTPEAYKTAGEELVRLVGERHRRVEFFRPMKEAAFAAHRAVCARENEALAPLRRAEQALSEGLVAYRHREEQLRREEQARWNAFSEAQALPAMAGMPDAAEWVPQQATVQTSAEVNAEAGMAPMRFGGAPLGACSVQVGAPSSDAVPPVSAFSPPAVVARDVPAVTGLSFAKEWEFEVLDPLQVPLTHDFYSLDEKKLRMYVRRLREHASIPGVRVFPKERSRARAA